MVEFLLFCAATAGMTSIITQGVIFHPFRQFIGDWADRIRVHREEKEQAGRGTSLLVSRRTFVEWFSELINCAQCTGFWCGLFCGLFLLTSDFLWGNTGGRMHDVQVLNRLLMWFCCGVGGSFVSALGCNLIDWVFYHKMNALRHLEEQDLTLAARRAELQHGQEPA